ncbi:hypothetical protein L596_005425 [Steinernema carpocapsae]|uniref:Uncharacterized protein n=1 Tax=Steinernema carpocapsae TaxID=34508 RepID=A0A4U8UYZ4_STECR|nr:hypothetical protein L596_005425 [Steinernema carpocapsae]
MGMATFYLGSRLGIMDSLIEGLWNRLPASEPDSKLIAPVGFFAFQSEDAVVTTVNGQAPDAFFAFGVTAGGRTASTEPVSIYGPYPSFVERRTWKRKCQEFEFFD